MKKLCGAKARSKRHQPCRRVAMLNGRCRLHGGLSTGPKTEEGRKKAYQAVFKHGFYTLEARKERTMITKTLRDTRDWLESLSASHQRDNGLKDYSH